MSWSYSNPLAEAQPCGACQAGQGAANSWFLGRVNGYGIFRCPVCRLMYVHPKLTPTEVIQLYANYHAETSQLDLSQRGERDLFAKVLDQIESSGKGELLDVGTSYGHFLVMARDRGYAVKGLEIAPEPCQYAREVLRLDVQCEGLSEARFESERFSTITLLNVLEHMSDPYGTLKECWRIAKPGGVIAVVVPNLLLAYPFFFITRKLGLDVRVPTSAYDMPYHLSLFAPHSLRQVLWSAGWTGALIMNAPVIRNRSQIRTFLKLTVKQLGDALAVMTFNHLVYGYSLLAVARKPLSRAS